MTTTKNIENIHFGKYHFLIWRKKDFSFKVFIIRSKFYRKYSLYLGNFIFEIGWLRYEKGNRRYI
jgi:hypothetical protein